MFASALLPGVATVALSEKVMRGEVPRELSHDELEEIRSYGRDE